MIIRNFRNNLLTIFSIAITSTYAQVKFEKAQLDSCCSKKVQSKIEAIIGPSFMYPSFDNRKNRYEKYIKFGYTIGFGILRPISKRVEINARIFYDKKGVEMKGIISGNDWASQYLKNNYVSVNLTLMYGLGLKKQFAVGIGGYISSLQKSETTLIINEPSIGYFARFTSNTYHLYKKYDEGLLVVIGYTILSSKLSTQLVVSKGLRNLNNDTPPPGYLNRSPIAMNNGLSIVAVLKL